jgi:ubiquitin-protein ligase
VSCVAVWRFGVREMASAQYSNPRQDRLATEWGRLQFLNGESENVKAEPVDTHPGSAPEKYIVTFLCKGIADIDPQTKDPVYQYRHQVEIYCHDGFPAEVPKLRWVTPIWHPNIQHEEPKGVCVNTAEWLAGRRLDDLCHQMFEMVQYKNYHAEFTPPYPLDHKVAHWVLEFAEPRGIVNRAAGRFVDDRPFVKPTSSGAVRFKSPLAVPASQAPSSIGGQPLRIRITAVAPPVEAPRVKFRN